MNRFIVWGFLFAALGLAATAQQASQHVSPQHRTMRMLAVGSDGSVISDDWSGFAVTGAVNSVTAVTGSWVVPAATCDSGEQRNTGASFWVGIDGYTSPTVEQIGTDSDCNNGSGIYYAWYEFVPAQGETITSITVQPGDVMSASVSYEGNQFTATITDERTNETFSISKVLAEAQRNSAEWIAEDNSYVFTNFGTVQFGNTATGVTATCEATVNGKTKAIGDFANYQPIFLAGLTSSQWFAVPSALWPDGKSFSVQWH
jgi:hypothetical protein